MAKLEKGLIKAIESKDWATIKKYFKAQIHESYEKIINAKKDEYLDSVRGVVAEECDPDDDSDEDEDDSEDEGDKKPNFEKFKKKGKSKDTDKKEDKFAKFRKNRKDKDEDGDSDENDD